MTLVLPAAAAAQGDVVSIPVKFAVENVNRSALPCASDGQSYELAGEIVGPRAVLEGSAPASATLYLHEFSYDDFFHFRAAPGVDYATEMARAGHVSVAIDRLGYDDSPHPPGTATCLGAHADMARQVIDALRAGSYRPAQGRPRGFQRIVLAGHSVGGEVAELEAYSFGGIDALVLFGVVDQGFQPRATQVAAEQGAVCARGGEDSGGAPGYAFYGDTPESVRDLSFYDADPAVVAASERQRHRDPCGDVNSNVPALGSNNAHMGEIEVPVLLLYGLEDGVMTRDAQRQHGEKYTGSADVTTAYFERTAHAMLLERTAPQVRGAVSRWLGERGLASEASPPAPPKPPTGCPARNAMVVGSDRADRLEGAGGADSLFGLAGDDRIAGKAGGDCIRGGPGRDLLIGDGGADRLHGDAGDDRISGGSSRDRLEGGKGHDRLRGGSGDDRLFARDGARDLVDCGPGGADRATVDRLDRVRGCERVAR
ncbi:MAG TPA: alpha/beta fold hydrolase [Thermoleophilaceae bacterium]